MNRLKVENILLPFICLLIMWALLWPFLPTPGSLDFHLHDTYIVINPRIHIFFLGYCILLFALYKYIRRKTGQVHFVTGLLHISITVLFIIYFLWLSYFGGYKNEAPRRYLDYSQWGKWHEERSLYVAAISIIIVVAAQIAFFVYLLAIRLRRTGQEVIS
jgi:heme/copper-type cytochrome/quinol oxidase subunit 1